MCDELVKERLKELKEYAIINNIPILRPQTAELLRKYVRECQPEKILEIGTAVGYSGIIMLSECKKAKLITIEKDEESILKAKENFGYTKYLERVTIKSGDVKDILPLLEEKFDFIFLDGPKGQYVRYFPLLAEKLNIGGILFSDNVLYRGMVNGKTPVSPKKKTLVKNLRLFLETLDSDERFENSTLEIEDGVSIAKKIKD